MKVKQDAFNKIKRTGACDTLLTYPDFNETFKIHIDASAFQLGSVIIHKGKPIPFYSRKLNDSQKMYIATERELPSIIINPEGVYNNTTWSEIINMY